MNLRMIFSCWVQASSIHPLLQRGLCKGPKAPLSLSEKKNQTYFKCPGICHISIEMYQKVSKTNTPRDCYLPREAGEKEGKKKKRNKRRTFFEVVIFKAVSLPKNVAGNLRLGVKSVCEVALNNAKVNPGSELVSLEQSRVTCTLLSKNMLCSLTAYNTLYSESCP